MDSDFVGYDKTYFEQMDLKNFNEANKRFFVKIVEHDLVRPLDGCKKILDCGCGTGNKMEVFIRNGKNVEGFDFIPEAVDYLKSKGLKGFVSSIYDIKAKDDTYDGCYSWCVFEHLDEPKKALHEIYRVLKPGGLVAISTETYSKDFFERDKTHVRYYTIEEAKNLFEEAGFTDITVKRSHYPFKGCIYMPHFFSVPASYFLGSFLSSIIIVYAKKPLKT